MTRTFEEAIPDPGWVQRFRRGVRRWYRRHGRVLPWCGEQDPYRVWVREVMLQQTTVTAVVPFLERFLSRFPDVEALAQADEEEGLRCWEGLGYYSRARNLHKAAQIIVDEWTERWPDDISAWRQLPGVGPYTAGAITSFALGQSSPIVEANTLRLYSRLMGMTCDPRRGEGLRKLWQFAKRIVPTTRPGEFNQALIDLGATVCRPDPDCGHCPVRSCCAACEMGAVEAIPVAVNRPAVSEVTETVVVVRRGAHVLLVKHPEGQRWAGLWDFPGWVSDPWVGATGNRARHLEEQLQAVGLCTRGMRRLDQLRHQVTRFKIKRDVYLATWHDGEWADLDREVCWEMTGRLTERPLCTPARRITRSACWEQVETAHTNFPR